MKAKKKRVCTLKWHSRSRSGVDGGIRVGKL